MSSGVEDLGPWWTVQRGGGPILATAIHDGHGLRPEVAAAMRLGDPDRLREEDPFTAHAILDVPTHVIVHRSRFEFDLNRGVEDAVYATPDQAWGLDVWARPPLAQMVERSLAIHAAYYRMLGSLLDEIATDHPRFVLIDVHSYNHRRGGSNAAPTDPADAPDVNIGTFSMPRDEWAFLLDPLMAAMAEFDFNGRRLDVRENVAFQGKGEQTRFVHQRYPGRGCAIALEFKKFFMDEWTGEPDQAELEAMRRFIAFTAERADALLQ
ncbi:N-formylglutamate amidohydrolase [Sphingomonas xanthus]|uniref:N-formylglutamate amidohydrolase n=1 Tax=Sphingomonas xanthus TaxID=2594473 RepID=A0A516IRV9_9SPHN|nr:N-formylglutamate amidohydrolase [Sphingomonas xanthus]QDP19647.1 N-formylglutamate amidohydrolase [Sphingomonas xanthus]